MQPKSYVLYKFDELAKELNDLPKKEEFAKIVPIRTVEQFFGTYTALVREWQNNESLKSYLSLQLSNMIRDLDRIPLQTEFEQVVSRYYIRKTYGTYNDILKANGYMPNKDGVGRKKGHID